MTVLMAEKKIMSNVSGKIFDQQRTVDSLYIDPVLKDFAANFGKQNRLSLTFIFARIIEFSVLNKSKIKVNTTELKKKISRDGIKTTVRVEQEIYSNFTNYVKGELESSNSAYLNMVLEKMYKKQDVGIEFGSQYLENILIS
ncbi:hypothetical protein [Acinetobacter variabilis]|uniref:hypothetical protein n=1 Tax=Acinetobacter variabilis TaxID=70346 RepID=UPI0028A090F6|nr:hypothetical protein [Acinetobacter variabilis]